MAGIDNLKRRILKEDEENARHIIEEAESKAQEIVRQAKAKAEQLIKDGQEKSIRDAENRKDRIIARTQLDARNKVLTAKQEAIDRILLQTEEKINNMGKDEYTKFLEKLLLNSVETGDEAVILAQGDKNRVDPSLVARVNDLLISQKRNGKLSISDEKINIKSGFILKRGGIEINCSIQSQIRMLRERLEGEISNLLFQG